MDENVCTDFRDELLKSHNAFRAAHGCKQLKCSEELTKDTQMWADILADKGYIQFSELPEMITTSKIYSCKDPERLVGLGTNTSRGENISFIETNGHRPEGSRVSELWYKEKENFNHRDPRWSKDCMNFTQMIWKSTTDIGIGISKVRGQDKYVVVVQYKPSGNINTSAEFRKNVLPPNL